MSDKGYVWVVEAQHCTGGDWIPDGSFVARVDARLRAREISEFFGENTRVRKYVREEK